MASQDVRDPSQGKRSWCTWGAPGRGQSILHCEGQRQHYRRLADSGACYNLSNTSQQLSASITWDTNGGHGLKNGLELAVELHLLQTATAYLCIFA